MWIFTVDGFFSVVERRVDRGTGKVNIRARVQGDLVRFCKRMKLRNKIMETSQADYPFRVVTSKKTWGRYLSLAAEAIDYDNFKSRVMAVDGLERETVYLSVWSVMQRLERRGYAAGRRGVLDDPPVDLDGPLYPAPGRSRKGYNPRYPNVWESDRY